MKVFTVKRYALIFMTCILCTFCLGQSADWSDEQIKLINLDCLHQRGYTGKGVTIAHLDDGCDGCDKIEVFRYARENGYWKGSYDFVDDSKLKYNGLGSHGTATLSIVHGKLDGRYIGAAYDANILLARTENIRSETHQEEIDWRAAVDWSLDNGADIITSSLQYNEFDKGEGNYEYKDMDGETTIITKAADYAASKGLVVITLQGNFGNDSWYYVTAPGDADSVITVGAARKDGMKAKFSGFGPSFDGRVKPDIMAMGEGTAVAKPDNSIVRGNGTSYAAPAIAGMMACLKQAHPERSHMQLISAVRRSGDRYYNPGIKDGYGYGIADACKADDILSEMDQFLKEKTKWVTGEMVKYKKKKNKLVFKSQHGKIQKLVLKNVFEKELNTFLRTKNLKIDGLERGDYLVDIYLPKNRIQTIYFDVY